MQRNRENLIKLIIYLEPETRTVRAPYREGALLYSTKKPSTALYLDRNIQIEEVWSVLWDHLYPKAFKQAEQEMHEKEVDDYLLTRFKSIV